MNKKRNENNLQNILNKKSNSRVRKYRNRKTPSNIANNLVKQYHYFMFTSWRQWYYSRLSVKEKQYVFLNYREDFLPLLEAKQFKHPRFEDIQSDDMIVYVGHHTFETVKRVALPQMDQKRMQDNEFGSSIISDSTAGKTIATTALIKIERERVKSLETMSNKEKNKFEWAVHSIVGDDISYDKNGDVKSCMYLVKWIDEREGRENMSQKELDIYADSWVDSKDLNCYHLIIDYQAQKCREKMDNLQIPDDLQGAHPLLWNKYMQKVNFEQRRVRFENENAERGTWRTSAEDRAAVKRRAEEIVAESIEKKRRESFE